MSRPFAITAASNSVFLNEDRQGEAGFTVSNQSGHSIDGRARLVAEDAEAESWIALQGAAQRRFSTAGTEQYTVEIDVPRDAPSGNYELRLDMVGEERPDEQYVEGPSVTFQVPETEPDDDPFPWKIVAAVAAVLLIGGGVLAYNLLTSDTATVPDVSGLRYTQATDSLQAAGFQVSGIQEEPNDSIPPNMVIATDPGAQEEVEAGTSVNLRVSSGPAVTTVPDVEGDSFLEAIRQLDESGLTPTELHTQNHNNIPANRVIGTKPAADEEIRQGGDLMLIVSTGPSDSGGGVDLGDFTFPTDVFNGKVYKSGQTIQLNPQQLQSITDSLQKADSNP